MPKGCQMFLPLGLLHMSSALYKDADRFLPERWEEADAEYISEGKCSLCIVSHELCPVQKGKSVPVTKISGG